MAKGLDLDRAIDHANGVTRLAKLLRVNQSTVSNWKVRGVPRGRWLQISEVTGLPLSEILPRIDAPKRARA